MTETTHAARQLKKRSIPRLIVTWLLDYGARQHGHRGATIYYWSKRAKRDLEKDGAFEEAAHLVHRALSDFERWVDGLDDARQRIQRLQRTLRAVSRRWEGRSKRYAYTLSKSMMMQERDLRSRDVGEWHEHVGD